jgi:hypothetical protein
MQFGKTLVGAIIGAALGIGLLIAVYLAFGIDKMWMAIPVALLTGLGVRMVAATSGRASYLRGAITVLLAMGAYMGGLAITKVWANHKSQTVAKQNPARVANEGSGEAGQAKAEEPAANAPPVDAAPVAPTKTDAMARRPSMPQPINTWDFLSLAVAALVAYELGRGTSGVHGNSVDTGPSEPIPVQAHPDA